MRYQAIGVIFTVIALASPRAGACLRDQFDKLAAQWASLIVEARLVDVSERVEIRAVAGKRTTTAGKKAEVSAVYWYRLYSFEVQTVLDGGGVKPKHRIEVIRFFGRVDDPTADPKAADLKNPQGARPALRDTEPACPGVPTRSAIGKTFLLALRPEQDFRMAGPPVWNDPKGDLREKEVHDLKGLAVVWGAPVEKLSDEARAEVKRVLTETRSADRKTPDAELKKQVELIVNGTELGAVERAAETLQREGWRAAAEVKRGIERGATADVMGRLVKLMEDLSPPLLPLELGAVVE